jgi:hypothetical protein
MRLASAWHCRPSEIDEERDADEIGVQIELWRIKGEHVPRDQYGNPKME